MRVVEMADHIWHDLGAITVPPTARVDGRGWAESRGLSCPIIGAARGGEAHEP